MGSRHGAHPTDSPWIGDALSVMISPEGTAKRALLPPHPEDDSSRRRIPKWFAEAAGQSQYDSEGAGSALTQGSQCLGSRQTAFDAEVWPAES